MTMSTTMTLDYDNEDKLFFSLGSGDAAGKTAAVPDEEGEAEEVQDWTRLRDLAKGSGKGKKKLNKSGLKTTGKNADKEFQPIGSNYELDQLAQNRNTMYETLSMKRGLQSQTSAVNQNTIFFNSYLNRCYMYSPKGVFLKTIGKVDKFQRCWLEPEEALYLLERGSCIAKSDSGVIVSETNIELDREHEGVPFSLEELYSYLILKDSDYDHYCVYSNLKRLGYIVQRTQIDDELVDLISDPDSDQDIDGGEHLHQSSFQMTLDDYSRLRQKISQNLSILLLNNFKNAIFQPLVPVFQWCKRFLVRHQLLTSSIFAHDHFYNTFYKSYKNIFAKLRIMMPSVDIPLDRTQQLMNRPEPARSGSPYSSFTFDVWKPTPDFSKKAPPIPDFQVCVVNINNVKFPTFEDIKRLMSLSDTSSNRYKSDIGKSNTKKRFADLKAGYRNSLFAVLDHGVINYISLKEMDFMEETEVYKEHVPNPQKGKIQPKIKEDSKPAQKRATIAQEVLGFFNLL